MTPDEIQNMIETAKPPTPKDDELLEMIERMTTGETSDVSTG
jgi:hypothetical protein